jgi:hypothetical protein
VVHPAQKPSASAVWFAGAMGLLDDAIREHLELKRLKGADPGAVAREAQDALAPVRREAEKHDDGRHDSEEKRLPAVDSSAAGQETIEINMEVELGTGTDPERKQQATQPEPTAPVTHAGNTQVSTQDSLEWEMPSDRPQETMRPESDGVADFRERNDPEPAGQVDDVLEETPDFLRDTPEQERLWFEQRPPRDFDFNE